MNHANPFTQAVRVANFSEIALSVDHLLEFDSQNIDAIVKKIRRYADLPYVFVVSASQTQRTLAVVSALKAMRSPCLPYALFTLADADLNVDDTDVDIVRIDGADAATIGNHIEAYARSRLGFDIGRLRVVGSMTPPPTVDVVIVGSGITGLYAANQLKQNGISFCVVEKTDKVGGIWATYANATSRVNTSECAYRPIDNKPRSNRDHSATREILEDLTSIAKRVSDHLYLETEVQRIEKRGNRYRISYTRDGTSADITSKGVILCINDRVGIPKEIEWENQAAFQGDIVVGISGNVDDLDWRNKKVVIVGMGAFAVENARTALEGGASHVAVICRRHGTVCPKIIDYLNFATPYDESFRHDKKSNLRNMMYWKKIYELSGATQPECWMGKVKHDGHTISVSDIWFVGHYLKRIETVTGSISAMFTNGVVVNGHRPVEADIVVNCLGFERNVSVAKALCGYPEMNNINYVDKDFMYLADAYIDDDAFNSFFGSSVLEMVKFYLDVYIEYFDSPYYDNLVNTAGVISIPMEDRRWSHYISGATALIEHHADLYEVAKKQVSQRTANFLEKHDLATYIAENKREWIDLHNILAGRPLDEPECMPYVFEKLLPTKG